MNLTTFSDTEGNASKTPIYSAKPCVNLDRYLRNVDCKFEYLRTTWSTRKWNQRLEHYNSLLSFSSNNVKYLAQYTVLSGEINYRTCWEYILLF